MFTTIPRIVNDRINKFPVEAMKLKSKNVSAVDLILWKLSSFWKIGFWFSDSQEGPHSALCDEEFYDAVETGLDRIEEENLLKDRLKQKSVVRPMTPTTPAARHRLWPEVI